MNLRKALFEVVDYVQGNPVTRHILDIESLLNQTSLPKIQQRQSEVLADLLNTVVQNTEFYEKYQGWTSLQDFPVVNKYIIRSQFDAINLPIAPKQRISVKTSGSTGTPFQLFHNQEKKVRNTADTIYFSRKAGFEIGYRLLYLRHWGAYYKKPGWLAKIQNVDQLEVTGLSDGYIQSFLKDIVRDTAPKSWLGQGSGFDKLLAYLNKEKYTPVPANIRSIIAISEALYEETRQKMEHYFGCPVVSRYSNVENGIIAQQDIGKSHFTINWASYIVEILKLDSDNPAPYGELGRIVVTDLYNRATPLIRYDTGDLGIMEIREDELPVLARIDGRKSDILTNTSGEVISPFIFHATLSEYDEISQVQLIQKNKQYTFRINTSGKTFTREPEFLAHYQQFLGADAQIQVVYVDEIPVLQSGKRKLVVNEGPDH
jgi:phenylacetate-CoA ligase